MKIKICSRCKKELEIINFHKNKSRKDKLSHECKICANSRQREKKYKRNNQTRKNYLKNYYVKMDKNKFIEYKNSHKKQIEIYNNSPKEITRITYVAMKRRCYNSTHDSYKSYGSKGIKVCDRWLSKVGFHNFIKDMGCRPSKNYCIHRLDSDYNYCPENCKWILKTKHRQIHRRIK